LSREQIEQLAKTFIASRVQIERSFWIAVCATAATKPLLVIPPGCDSLGSGLRDKIVA